MSAPPTQVHKIERSNWGERLEAAVMFSAMAVCLLVVAKLFGFNIFTIYKIDLNVAEAQVVGTVTYTNNSVRKRPVQLPVWIDAQAKDPVVRGDQLFTDAGSKATITFNNGVSVDVLEHSLIVIEELAQMNSLEVLEGEVLVALPPKTDLRLTQGKAEVEVSGEDSLGSVKISVKRASNGRVDVHAIEGDVKFALPRPQASHEEALATSKGMPVDEPSQVGTIISQAVSLDPVSGVQVGAFRPQLLYPKDQSHFEQGSRQGILFSWQYDQDEIRQVFLELSKDEEFKRPALRFPVQSSSKVIRDLEAGAYYWRVVYNYRAQNTKNAVTRPRRLEVSPRLAVSLVAPFPWQRFTAQLSSKSSYKTANEQARQEVFFSWQEATEHRRGGKVDAGVEDKYLLEVASNSEFKNPVVRARYDGTTTSTYLALPGEGTYFWRVGKLREPAIKADEETLWSPIWAFVLLQQVDEAGSGSTANKPGGNVVGREIGAESPAGLGGENEGGDKTLPPPKIIKKEFIGH